MSPRTVILKEEWETRRWRRGDRKLKRSGRLLISEANQIFRKQNSVRKKETIQKRKHKQKNSSNQCQAQKVVRCLPVLPDFSSTPSSCEGARATVRVAINATCALGAKEPQADTGELSLSLSLSLMSKGRVQCKATLVIRLRTFTCLLCLRLARKQKQEIGRKRKRKRKRRQLKWHKHKKTGGEEIAAHNVANESEREQASRNQEIHPEK